MQELTHAVHGLIRAARILEGATIATGDLTLADYRVLAMLTDGEARASRLATRLALGKPAISATVESLHRRGLLDREAVEGDNRATALSVTAAGLEVLARTEERMARQLELLARRAADPAALTDALGQLGDAVEAAVVDRETRAEQAR